MPDLLQGLDWQQREKIDRLRTALANRGDLTRRQRREMIAQAVARLRGSPLEQRAAEVRTNFERGRQFERFDSDVRQGRAKPPLVTLAPKVEPRYSLDCIDCGWTIWLHSPKARVPICDHCEAERGQR